MSELAARCAVHPDVPATMACPRCGTFVCAQDTATVEGIAYCTTCSSKYLTDRIEAYRANCAGKRSAVEWAFLSAVPFQLGFAFAAFQGARRDAGMAVLAPVALLSALNGVHWFSGRLLARKLHLGLVGAWAAGIVTLMWHEPPAAIVIGVVTAALFGFAPMISLRSKLFFGLPVSREQIARLLGIQLPGSRTSPGGR